MTNPDATALFRKAFPGEHDSESDTVLIVRDATGLDRQNVWNIVRTNRMSPVLALAIWRAARPIGNIEARELGPYLHRDHFGAYRDLAADGLFS